MDEETKNRWQEFHRDNINEIRKWTFQVVILSGAIIGFSLPIFGARNDLLEHPAILKLALLLLWLIVIYGLAYILFQISSDNHRIAAQAKNMGSDVVQRMLKDKFYTHFAERTFGHKKLFGRYVLDCIFLMFFMATSLIIIATIPF